MVIFKIAEHSSKIEKAQKELEAAIEAAKAEAQAAIEKKMNNAEENKNTQLEVKSLEFFYQIIICSLRKC